MKLKRIGVLTGVALLSGSLLLAQPDPQAPPAAPAPAPAPAATNSFIAAPSFGKLKFSGVFDGYYSFNNNHPSSGVNLYRNFDIKANDFGLALGKVGIEYEPSPIGFRIDVGYGDLQKVYHAFDPPRGNRGFRYLLQAYVTAKPFKDKGTTIDFGQFYTSAGAEPTETFANWNYTRSFLFALGPYYHTGVRVTQPLKKGFTVGAQLVTGWNSIRDNNSGKTVGLTASWSNPRVSISETVYVGPEKLDSNKGFRKFYDTVVTVTATSKLSLSGNFDFGREKLIGPGVQDFWGVSGMARYQLTSRLAVAGRSEFYHDKGAWATGTAQKLKEVTMTGEYKLAEGLLTRFEFRRDASSMPVFERGTGGTSKTQNTLLVGLVAAIGPKK